MSNNQDKFKDQLNYLKYQTKFSVDEIIPVLENKISKIKNEDYMIDFFITNEDESSLLDVTYFAFPRKDAYTKMIINYKGFTYTYTKTSNNRESLKKIATKDIESTKLDIMNDENSIIIAKEKVQIKNVFKYLILPHEEQYHLFNNFFCYEPEFDELSDTITEFAKKKTPQK